MCRNVAYLSPCLGGDGRTCDGGWPQIPSTLLLTLHMALQVEQLYARQLVEEAGKSCGAGSLMPALEEPQLDQAFRMFPDICTSHQRPFFRENQQITV